MIESSDFATCGGGEDHCITCGDEGIAMMVIEVRAGIAVCADSQRAQHHIALDFVEPVAAGDELLVHAGVAIMHLGGQRREVRR